MVLQFITLLRKISQSNNYWLSLIFGSISLLAAALYFQHVLDEQPCVVCIQVRLLLSTFIIVSMIALVLKKNKFVNPLMHLSVVLIAVSFVERSYLLLGTERGFIFSDCGFSLGLPTWFAIEEWLPWLYRIETSCGYTPELIFGITMAEALMVLSVVTLAGSFCVFAASFTNKKSAE